MSSSGRVCRLFVAGVVMMIAGALSWVAVGVPSASAAPETAGVERFGACVAAQKSGRMLLLIDESSSLQNSDPQAARVSAAKYLVEQLGQYAADTGSAIDVAVAGFSDTYAVQLNWTRLGQATIGQVTSTLDSFRDRNTGVDTDYWTALDGALATLADRSTAPDGRSCQSLAWFSDGKLDFSTRAGVEKPYAPGVTLDSPQGVEATIAAAKQSICRPGGLADQLRSSEIIMFGIGLVPDPARAADLDLMKAIATGQPTSAGECGDIRTPPPGDFFLAQNIDDLIFAFDALSTPGQPPQRTEADSCVGTVCEQGKHRFVLDRSVRAVTVLAAADRPGLTPLLIAPNGESTELTARSGGRVDIGGVQVDYRWPTDKSVSVRMANSEAPQWQGVWAVVFVAPPGDPGARTRSSIHIFGDLYPAWAQAATTTLHSGDSDVPVTFSVVDSRNNPVDPATLLGSATLSATLTDSTGEQHPVATGVGKEQILTPRALDLTGVPAGRATLRMTLEVTTADAVALDGTPVPGTVLAPQTVDLSVTVDPPVGYPKIGTAIDFGTIEGSGSFPGALQVTGPGCVWIASDAPTSVVAAPDGVTGLQVTSTSNSQEGCRTLGDGQTGELPVSLVVPHQGNGVANGTVVVMLAPADGSAPPLQVTVPFTTKMQKQLDTTKTLIVVIVALILGPGIPLLLLYGLKWFNAKIPARALRAEQIPVQVDGSSVQRDGRPFSVRDGELVRLVPGLDTRARRVDLGGIELRTRIGRSPLGQGYVVASAPPRAGAGGKAAAMHGTVPNARLPLDVHNRWFVLYDPAGPPDAATVVLLISGDAGPEKIKQVADEISASLPGALEALRRRTAPPSGRDAHTPGPFGPPADPFRAGPDHRRGDPFAGRTSPPHPDPFGGGPSGRGPYPGSGTTGADPFRPSGGVVGAGDPFRQPGPDPFRPPPGPDPFGPPGGPGTHPQDPFRPR